MDLIEKIRKDYFGIISNTFYLTVIEIIRHIMPFVALPYVIGKIGVENYGKVVLSQTIISYFTIIVDFGLNIVTVKEISINRNDKEKINDIISSFLTIRLALAMIGVLVLLGIICVFPAIKVIGTTLLLTYITVFGEALLITSFFQGIEKMGNITIIKTLSIALYTAGVFSFIKEENDYNYVALLQSAGVFISSLVGIIIMMVKYGVRFRFQSNNKLIAMVKDCFPFLLSRVSVVLNGNIGKMFAGLVLGMNEISIIDLVQKITSGVVLPLSMIDQAIYPYNAKNKNKRFATICLLIKTGLGIACAAVAFIAMPYLVDYLGDHKLGEGIFYGKILCIYIVLCSISCYLGTPMLVAFGHSKPFNQSVIYAAFISIMTYFTLYYTGTLSILTFTLTTILCELAIIIQRFYYCSKYGLIQTTDLTNNIC